MIKTENLTKIHTTEEIETSALDGVNLEVEEGKFIAIMGPSGSGKSTLLNVLGLLDAPTRGTYHFLDEEVSKASERRRTNLRKKHMGFVFQAFNLIDEMTVFENVELPMLYGKTPESERRRRVDEVLQRVRMTERRNHFPMQLSGGQRQRTAVARAVVGNPVLILADEPTGNLDSAHGSEVMQLLRDLNNDGTTIVMVTHAPDLAELADYTLNLLDGKLSS
jgi:putative ABC transport system ATP-binding protein